MKQKSTIRYRVWIVIGFIILNIIGVFFVSKSHASISSIWFFGVIIFAFLALRQKCEVCGLPWYEKNFPIKVDKTIKNIFWQRDFYPDPFAIATKCPKCGTERV